MARQVLVVQTRNQKAAAQSLRSNKPSKVIKKNEKQNKSRKIQKKNVQVLKRSSPSPSPKKNMIKTRAQINKKPEPQQLNIVKRTKSIEEVMKQAKDFIKQTKPAQQVVFQSKDNLIAERLRNQIPDFARVTRNVRKQYKIDSKQLQKIPKINQVNVQQPQKIIKKAIKKTVKKVTPVKPKQKPQAPVYNNNNNNNQFVGLFNQNNSVFNQANRSGFVDVIFCCDTIMTNMKAIKETVQNVCKQIKQNEQKLVDVKFGFVWYYDHKSKVSNKFIQRIKNLCSAEEILKFVDEQKCYEFGEYPQEMEQDFESTNNNQNDKNNLQSQMNKIAWRGQTDSIDTLRYVYYIGEAPPDRVSLPGMQRQDYAQGCPCINNQHYQQMYNKFNNVESNAFKRDVYYKCVVSGNPKIFYHKKQ
ncbi:hypothetical protein PPERSA_10515 [Pseudocohnilembus persalinus]|uniref:Uncharacterized protein n=1 Tax=Pseudocohnilembus persalinus TaxID=266149 RepID=A0A0V0R7T3_PSEPJ|nr:hypothetical protein PPERSA_10515 [Pseudocohnilembus persalinus]|eukprot:KRX10416.1 hypothetical protein PPERSA_10515 [Pseudocohnilembus persalinus]